jgi:hypothetical protein
MRGDVGVAVKTPTTSQINYVIARSGNGKSAGATWQSRSYTGRTCICYEIAALRSQ